MSAITIFRGGAIGDFVLTLPAIDAVRRAFPDADLRLIGRPATLALGPAASVLDGEDPRLIALHRDGSLPPATRQIFAATQRVLAYAVDSQQHFGPQLRRAVAGPVLLWDPRPPADFRGHIVDHLLGPLRQWGLPVCNRTPHIELQPDDYGYVDALTAAPEVVIHLGSGSPAKCWPLANFHALASALQKRGWHTALLCGPVERERQTSVGSLPALHPPDLRSLAGLLAKTALFIGNDSGPGHIAAAVGTPTLTLFGPTDLGLWAPCGRRSQVLQAPAADIAAIPTAAAIDAALALLQSAQ
ncbi:MAG: glycosyltransferase family 9 protein [Gemmatimonadota bacterium]|nr:glycosyltransferase family 9 protein [Gemmatimonadota bacterium]